MRVCLIGLNQTAPLEVREQLSIPPSGLPAALEILRGLDGVLGWRLRSGRIVSIVSKISHPLIAEEKKSPQDPALEQRLLNLFRLSQAQEPMRSESRVQAQPNDHHAN